MLLLCPAASRSLLSTCHMIPESTGCQVNCYIIIYGSSRWQSQKAIRRLDVSYIHTYIHTYLHTYIHSIYTYVYPSGEREAVFLELRHFLCERDHLLGLRLDCQTLGISRGHGDLQLRQLFEQGLASAIRLWDIKEKTTESLHYTSKKHPPTYIQATMCTYTSTRNTMCTYIQATTYLQIHK
jgi:hypothetical protein